MLWRVDMKKQVQIDRRVHDIGGEEKDFESDPFESVFMVQCKQKIVII
jgi:hypothetical protein